MKTEKAPDKGKETFTLRIPYEQNRSIQELAKKSGASQNSLILLFIEIGLNMTSQLTPEMVKEFLLCLSQKKQ